MNGATPRRSAAWLAGAVVALVMLTACDKPASQPTPTPSPSATVPSPQPTATADADGRALPGFVTVSADLPAAQAAPAGVLSGAGPGWSLQTYRPQVEPVTTFSGVTPGFPATVQVVYLVSPTGQRYQLLALDPAKPLVINSWTAGESVAYVTQCDPLDCDPTAPTEILDLNTGELTAVTSLTTTTSLDADMRIGATIVGSHRWWQNDATVSALESAGHLTVVQHDWRAVSASPDGAYLAVVRGDEYSPYITSGVAVVDVATGALTDIAALWGEPLKCTPFRWRADNALDLSCYDPTRATWRVFTVGPGAEQLKENKSATATPPVAGPWVQPDFFVSDGVWAGPYTADADARLAPDSVAIGIARNAGFEALAVPDAGVGAARIVAAVDGVLYVEATQANNLSLKSAWAYDVASGAWTELGSLPPSGPTRGLVATQGSPASGLTSWAIAP